MQSKNPKCRQEIRRLQKRIKQSPMVFARLGECYLEAGDWENAKEILEKGLEDYPDYITGYLVLGEGYFSNGLLHDAEECALKGLEKNPHHLGLLELLKKIKQRSEEEQEVVRLQRTIRSIDPLAEGVSPLIQMEEDQSDQELDASITNLIERSSETKPKGETTPSPADQEEPQIQPTEKPKEVEIPSDSPLAPEFDRQVEPETRRTGLQGRCLF